MTRTKLHTPYALQLTADELKTLLWLEARGYTANLYKHADIEEAGPNGTTILRYSEPAAWQVQEEYEQDTEAFLTCAGPELVNKIYDFLNRII